MIAYYLGFRLTCDESCEQHSGWQHDPHAWQWLVLGWSGVVCLIAALGPLTATSIRSIRLGAATLTAWAVSVLAGGIVVGLGGGTVKLWFGVLVLGVIGATAVLLIPARFGLGGHG